MISNSFSILSGIGGKLEQRLWSHGILSWDDFLGADAEGLLSLARKATYDDMLSSHSERLRSLDAEYFSEAVKNSEHWRLYDAFGSQAVCLDIETNGKPLGAGGYVTCVGLYDGSDFKYLLRGEGLSAESLMHELSNYKYLITFYGSVFDMPFLAGGLPGFQSGMPHFDLCFGARRLGMRGGLKKIEVAMGIERPGDTVGMNGYDAVLLWERARRGDGRALELLVKYNREDTVNLWRIAHRVYGGLRDSTGIGRYLPARRGRG